MLFTNNILSSRSATGSVKNFNVGDTTQNIDIRDSPLWLNGNERPQDDIKVKSFAPIIPKFY